jgi:hypothetical protein
MTLFYFLFPDERQGNTTGEIGICSRQCFKSTSTVHKGDLKQVRNIINANKQSAEANMGIWVDASLVKRTTTSSHHSCPSLLQTLSYICSLAICGGTTAELTSSSPSRSSSLRTSLSSLPILGIDYYRIRKTVIQRILIVTAGRYATPKVDTIPSCLQTK